MNSLTDLLKDEIPNGRFWNKAWSLVRGCSHVSPGCDHCWLASMARRFDPDTVDDATGRFTGQVFADTDRLDIPLKRRKPTVYAVWSDLFHESVPDEFIGNALGVMYEARQHYFIIVTKRPEQAARFIQKYTAPGGSMPPYVAPNVIILVTMEDQQRADERAPYALQLASMGWKVGALCEPMLGPVDLIRAGLIEYDSVGDTTPGTGISFSHSLLSWIITGGESGPGARPANPDWFRSLRDRSQAAGVPFLLKHIDKKHGRLLDEQEHDEVPNA